jgi:hypothetical protein
MKKLFNLLKRKKKDMPKTNIPVGDPNQMICINNRNYYVEKKADLSIQANPNDIKPYGWTLEFRWKHRDSWTNWTQYWNKKTYDTRTSAINAFLQVKGYVFSDREVEYRVSALYKMDDIQYRDYKIDKLLSSLDVTPKEVKPKPIQFFKIMEDYEIQYKHGLNSSQTGYRKYKKGELFVKLEDGRTIRTGSPTEPTIHHWCGDLNDKLIPGGIAQEVDIMKEKWYHPHLIKSLKDKYNVR